MLSVNSKMNIFKNNIGKKRYRCYCCMVGPPQYGGPPSQNEDFRKVLQSCMVAPPHNGKIFGRRPKILVKNNQKIVHFF